MVQEAGGPWWLKVARFGAFGFEAARVDVVEDEVVARVQTPGGQAVFSESCWCRAQDREI